MSDVLAQKQIARISPDELSLRRCSGSDHRPLLIAVPSQTHKVLGINEDNILLQASTARPVDERATGKPRPISFFPNPLSLRAISELPRHRTRSQSHSQLKTRTRGTARTRKIKLMTIAASRAKQRTVGPAIEALVSMEGRREWQSTVFLRD